MHPAGTGGWDPATNIFTCPITGFYHFFLSLYKQGGSINYNCWAELMKSAGAGEVVVRLENFNYNSAGVIFTSTAQAIIPCEAGEWVWVRMGTPCRLYDGSSYHYNQFSGALVRPGVE